MNQEPTTETDPTEGSSATEETSNSPQELSDEERHQSLQLKDFVEMEKKASERDKFLDHLQRKEAELINYRKRVQKEKVESRRFGAQPLILDLLPNLNAFELALQAAQRLEGTEAAEILQGFELLYQRFCKGLGDHGVLEIEADGKPFDPMLHEVMLSEESTEVPHMNITQVIQKGYRLHDRLLIPTRVKVACRPSDQDANATDQAESSDSSDH